MRTRTQNVCCVIVKRPCDNYRRRYCARVDTIQMRVYVERRVFNVLVISYQEKQQMRFVGFRLFWSRVYAESPMIRPPISHTRPPWTMEPNTNTVMVEKIRGTKPDQNS